MKDIIEIGRRYGDLIALANPRSGIWSTTCDNHHRSNSTTTKTVKDGVCKRCRKEKPIYVGDQFGKLTVIEQGRPSTKCRCECGKETLVRNFNLNAGHTKSCGCGRTGPRDKSPKPERASLYRVWANVGQRTSNPNMPEWHCYGGRGIENHLGTYATFRAWAFANGYRAGLTLDRTNNNGHYEYGNLRWATHATQARNNRRTVLNEDLVREIRRLSAIGHMPTAILHMLDLRCCTSTVSAAARGITWRDIS